MSTWSRSGASASARRGWPVWRTAPLGSAADVRLRGGGGHQGYGVRAARAPRCAAVALEFPRARRPGGHRGAGRLDLVVDGAALAARRRDQAVAVSVVDLPPRPRLRHQGGPGPRPLRAALGGRGARPRRLRDLGGREVPAPGARPLPPRPRPGPGAAPAGRVRVRAGRHAGLLRRLRRPRGTPVRQRRREDRHRAVHGARRAGDDHRALRQRATRLLGRRQRVLAQRAALDRPDGRARGRTPASSTCPCTPPG